MLTICNEPVQPLANLRTPRIWQTILSPDLPGKIALARIQLNHALVDEERQTLDKRLLALYTNVIAQFAKRHGDSTRCFLVRAPESLNLVGHHIKEFGGATNGIACYETVFCVSPRTDGRVAISHVEDRFAPVEFELLDGLPKARVLDWARHLKERAAQKPAASWADAIRLALQYYVNRHKGPTGQIELTIPGVNIVVGAILPAGLTTHSQTTLAAASLISLMGLTGEWGKLPLAEFANWLGQADAGAHGRRSDPGPIVFGMPGEIVHVNYHPARAKGKALPHGFAFLTAHAGAKPACGHDGPKIVDVYKTPAVRATTTAAALALFRQIVKSDGGLGLGDNHVYELLLQIPERATRAEILKRITNDEVRAALQTRFASHDEPAGGYNLREKLLFVLSEIRRAHRAADVIRAGDPLGIAALMNVSQAGECTTFNDVNALGQVRESFAVPSCVSDAEIEAQALGDEPLWRQTGKSGASTIETDLLCDIALAVGGVLGARYVEPNRVAILCKADIADMVLATLHSGYYGPRGFATPLAEQIFPCQGAGIVAI